VTVRAVIFDWGGTLTPWHTVDHEAIWQQLCVDHFGAPSAEQLAAAILAAEAELWHVAREQHRGATMDDVFARAGVTPVAAFIDAYFTAWEPHTFTDPGAEGVLRELRAREIKVGVLSNTMWPRHRHEEIFIRDGIMDLIDGAVYSSELGVTKPDREAFLAAMTAVGVTDPATCVFVGDRLYDDIYGAHGAGMRTVHMPHSAVPHFAAAMPDAVIQKLADLTEVIEAW
jgi:putative hydrolase of the HAD superfamily